MVVPAATVTTIVSGMPIAFLSFVKYFGLPLPVVRMIVELAKRSETRAQVNVFIEVLCGDNWPSTFLCRCL